MQIYRGRGTIVLVGWVMALAMACRTSSLVRESISSPPEAPRLSD